jgi:hypothetical protein
VGRKKSQPLSPEEAKARLRETCARASLGAPALAAALAAGFLTGISPGLRRAALAGVKGLIRGREKLAEKAAAN